MIVGESGLGKSTLVNTLFGTTLYPGKGDVEPTDETPKTVEIQSLSAGMYNRECVPIVTRFYLQQSLTSTIANIIYTLSTSTIQLKGK